MDLKRTFDSISHHSIRYALRRFRVDEDTSHYIMTNFEGASTTIYCEGEEMANIHLRREMKQGGPLASLLFNMVLDELISSLRIRS